MTNPCSTCKHYSHNDDGGTCKLNGLRCVYNRSQYFMRSICPCDKNGRGWEDINES